MNLVYDPTHIAGSSKKTQNRSPRKLTALPPETHALISKLAERNQRTIVAQINFMATTEARACGIL